MYRRIVIRQTPEQCIIPSVPMVNIPNLIAFLRELGEARGDDYKALRVILAQGIEDLPVYAQENIVRGLYAVEGDSIVVSAHPPWYSKQRPRLRPKKTQA